MHLAFLLMPLLVFLPLLVFVGPVVVRLIRPCQASELTSEWRETFQTSYYYAMQGLLSVEDFQFLSRQQGFDPSLYRKLRRDRLKIFRQYLNRLIVDFNRLHRIAIIAVAKTEEDHSELLTRLIKIRIRFSFAVLQVEFCYLLCRFGMHSLSVSNLLARLDEMSGQLALLPKIKLTPALL